jgi:cytidyltransferase-like protein
MATICITGRFDRPHIGHIITLQKLAEVYDTVIVIVLGYENEKYSVRYRYQILCDCLKRSKGNFIIYINREDWSDLITADITAAYCKRLLSRYEFDVYGTGNLKFLKAVEMAGIKAVYVERSYDYAATDDRLIQDIKSIFKGI